MKKKKDKCKSKYKKKRKRKLGEAIIDHEWQNANEESSDPIDIGPRLHGSPNKEVLDNSINFIQ